MRDTIEMETLLMAEREGRSLEQYLLDMGILDARQLILAKKMQRQEQGPLLMILLRLSFIDIEQLNGLMGVGFAMGV